MARSKTQKIIEKVTITGIGAEGKAIARIGDKVVFVTQAVPGDIVNILLTHNRRRYMEGIAVFFHAYSSLREKPFCEHFGTCGGCKWQMLPYSEQLKCKQQQVADHLQRIGKVDFPALLPILPSEKITGYRNKMEYTFSTLRWYSHEEFSATNLPEERRALGLHTPGKFDRVTDIVQCYLQPEPSNAIRNAVKEYAIKNDYLFYNQHSQEGFLRNLIIRTSSSGEVMAILVFKYDDPGLQNRLLDYIGQAFPEITSLLYIINPKVNDSFFDLDVHTYKGKDYITERLGDLCFRVGPKSFFQVNIPQTLKMYDTILQWANLSGSETVYDCYSGTGTIACYVAGRAKKVIGIENIEESMQNARLNSELNTIHNTKFITGNVEEILTQQFTDEHGKPDVLIADPPRAGIHSCVINNILQIEPLRIIYVSCNPATQARDINLLNEKYRIEKVQPVDMFPQTHHMENIILLTKKC